MAKSNQLPFNLLKENRTTAIIGGVLGLVAAYVLGSIAIDTGRWLYYFFALVSLIVAVRQFVRSMKYEKS